MKLTLGQQIKKKRIAQRISLRDLAHEIKVSPGTLSRMERDVTVTEVRDTTKEQVLRWLGGTDRHLPAMTKGHYNFKTFAKELAEFAGWKVAS